VILGETGDEPVLGAMTLENLGLSWTPSSGRSRQCGCAWPRHEHRRRGKNAGISAVRDRGKTKSPLFAALAR
jgi:hypothetical protein